MLPLRSDSISGDVVVGGEDGQAVCNCLADDDPVKGVSVVIGQAESCKTAGSSSETMFQYCGGYASYGRNREEVPAGEASRVGA